MAQDPIVNMVSRSVTLPAWMWDALMKEAAEGDDGALVSTVIRRRLFDGGLTPPDPPLPLDAVCVMCGEDAVKENRGRHFCAQCYEICEGCDGDLPYLDWRTLNGPLCFRCRRPDRWHRDGMIPLKALRRVRSNAVNLERLRHRWRQWWREWNKRR